MTPEELCTIGKIHFGNRWKTPLAKALSVTRETVSRWASGKQPISSPCAAAIRLLKQQPIMYKERRFVASYELQQIGDAMLINGDCRKVLLDAPVDVILTDPVWPNAISSLPGSYDPYALFQESIAHLLQYLSPKGRIIIQMRCDSDPRILSGIHSLLPFIRICWLPYALPSRQGRMLISGDVAYLYGAPPAVSAGKRILAGQFHSDYCPPAQSGQVDKKLHPCPRHLAHVEWLIEKFTTQSDIILDPFMGSGTTAVASLNRARKFIGIEIDRNYFTGACDRVRKLN